MSVVVMNEKVEKVEKVMKVKNMKLGVKYERMYMCLYTVLNRFCVSSSDDVSSVSEEGDGFVLKKSDMRKILDSVEFYNEDVVLQGEYMDANLFSKENMKKVRKSMKQERMNMKKGILEEEVVKKVRKPRNPKVVVDMVIESSVEHIATTPKMKNTKKTKKTKKEVEKEVEKVEIEMEKVEIEVGKVVVVVEDIGGGDIGEGVVEEVGGGDVVGGIGGGDVVGVGGDVVGVGGGDVVGGIGGEENLKKAVGKKSVKKPKKKSEMVEDFAI